MSSQEICVNLYEKCHSEGFLEGRKVGYHEGVTKSEDESGYTHGYNDGYKAGRIDGDYSKGIKDGMSSSDCPESLKESFELGRKSGDEDGYLRGKKESDPLPDDDIPDDNTERLIEGFFDGLIFTYVVLRFV